MINMILVLSLPAAKQTFPIVTSNESFCENVIVQAMMNFQVETWTRHVDEITSNDQQDAWASYQASLPPVCRYGDNVKIRRLSLIVLVVRLHCLWSLCTVKHRAFKIETFKMRVPLNSL